jgi:predicted DNA-binding protein (MmcQ/YjbR family)
MVIIGRISAMKKRTGGSNKLRQAKAALRDFALAYPGAREEFPWGERVVKVGKKVFVFLGMPDSDEIGLSVKLPQSGPMALLLPFATPTGYGLGKSGWVSARFGPSDDLPLGMLREWIDESYRAVAPAKLAKATSGGKPAPAVSGAPRRTGPRGGRPSGKKSSRSTARGRRPSSDRTHRRRGSRT